MPRSIAYWRQRWQTPNIESIITDEDAQNTLKLLSQYAGFSSSLLSFNVRGTGRYLRTFSGLWNVEHGEQVENAIAGFYVMSGSHAHIERYHNVAFILAQVKLAIGNTPINPNGNLALILEVIREKTGVNYANIDATRLIEGIENIAQEPRARRIPSATATVSAVPMDPSAVDPDREVAIAYRL
jgi:hypothetical protein